MALTGIQIYKLLPQTNCKDCGFPTCLAFAMKLAAKQIELSACPHVSAESKSQLSESAAPPVRMITLKASGGEVKTGNEVVLFRHEKTFYHRPGLFVRVRDTDGADTINAVVSKANAYTVSYVGMDFTLDGFAVEGASGNPTTFAAAVAAVRAISKRPLILISADPAVIEAGLQKLSGETPLISGADANNWQAMAALASKYKTVLALTAGSLDGLADLTEKIKGQGVEDMVLHPAAATLGGSLALNTQIRRLAIKKNFRPLGYPILALCGDADPAREAILASQAIAKYAGFVVIDHFSPETVYSLLVLRENIYTDPQKPIQV
ncbi:MAG: acetyl-CoA decarbonylase/synthase complex subunit gamma, partial [Chloroflexi bacterium]|nr:acetyl-CoA decarbonylase/synthase complex subunit gamma [Chloroflexota bacterium]